MNRKIGLALLLILFTNVALAQTTISAAPNTDLSVGYLSMLFGDVGNTLHGTSGQMLGKLFGVFNQGVYVVAVVVIIYGLVLTVIRAATEGTINSPQRNVYMMLLRISLGLGILFPSPTTGYSYLQNVMMKIVLQGVNLADMAWDSALDYLNDGGAIFVPPKEAMGNSSGATGMTSPDFLLPTLVGGCSDSCSSSSLPSATTIPTTQSQLASDAKNFWANPLHETERQKLSLVQKVVIDEMCMYRNQFIGASSSSSSTAIIHRFTPQLTSDNKVIFPNRADQTSEGACKAINVPTSFVQPNQESLWGAAAIKVADAALPAAKYLYCSSLASPSEPQRRFCSGYNQSISGTDINPNVEGAASSMQNAFLAYASSMQTLIEQNNPDTGKASRSFIDTAKEQGWIMAGAYYWNMIGVQSTITKAGSWANYVVPSTVDMPDSSSPNIVTAASASLGQASVLSYLYFKKDYISAMTSGGSSLGGDNAGPSGASVGLNVASSVLSIVPVVGTVINFFTGLANLTMTALPTHAGAASNPLMMLFLLGNQFINLCGNLLFGSLIQVGILALLGMFGQDYVNLVDTLTAALAVLMPVIIGMIVIFLSIGLMLSYYVPFYPYIIFIFGVIGWFIAVIESMVAMPLVALGLTHPEGHDFLGKAEQATMLMLSVFLRPVLMIIGLVAGMVLSFVAYRVIIWTFGSLMFGLLAPANATVTSGSFGAGLGQLIKHMSVASGGVSSVFGTLLRALLAAPTIAVIFAGMVYVVTQQCYNLISSVPEYVLRWIGGPQQTSLINPAQIAGQVQSAVSGAGQQVGQGLKQAADNMRMMPKKATITGVGKVPESKKGEEKNEDKPGDGSNSGTNKNNLEGGQGTISDTNNKSDDKQGGSSKKSISGVTNNTPGQRGGNSSKIADNSGGGNSNVSSNISNEGDNSGNSNDSSNTSNGGSTSTSTSTSKGNGKGKGKGKGNGKGNGNGNKT